MNHRLLLIAGLAVAVGTPEVVRGQSLLDRSPNVSGDWAGASGTLYFHFVHRFATSDPPDRKVSNVPTFLLAAGLPKRILAGVNYSTNSTLTPRFPNEWELFTRWLPISQDLGAPLDVGAQVGYNNAAEGVDAELSLARRFGIARALVAGRVLSDPFLEDNPRLAVAAGATVRLGQYLAIAGDVASLADRDSAERVAWSAGVHFAIPLTPHTVSIHATNAMVTTLQGSSRGTRDVRYGFEFTIPLTLRRYFGRRESVVDTATALAESPAAVVVPVAPEVPARVDTVPIVTPAPSAPQAAPPPAAAPAPQPAARPVAPPSAPATRPRTTSTAEAPRQAPRVVKVGIKNVSYLRQRLQVTVGTTVEWTNNDPMPHTVTATNRSFDSGLINPGKTFRYTFSRAGTFNVFCTPHPFMKGTIVVTEQ